MPEHTALKENSENEGYVENCWKKKRHAYIVTSYHTFRDFTGRGGGCKCVHKFRYYRSSQEKLKIPSLLPFLAVNS
jgi:hypothetical protein